MVECTRFIRATPLLVRQQHLHHLQKGWTDPNEISIMSVWTMLVGTRSVLAELQTNDIGLRLDTLDYLIHFKSIHNILLTVDSDDFLLCILRIFHIERTFLLFQDL